MHPEHMIDEVIDALDSVNGIEGLDDGDPSILSIDDPNIKKISRDDKEKVEYAIRITRQFLILSADGEPGDKNESFQEGIDEIALKGYETSFQRSQYDINKCTGWVKIGNIRLDLSDF
jgi:hypothetical protein